ncbi:MAG: RnfABCDGE type electron transport complex subunit D [Ruminococcus sp.]|nr:RnfABCDGE type electron transport complex subunit D [Ruminococcus sp.]
MQIKTKSDRFIWIDIMVTLLTLELMAYFYYGVRAVVLASVCAVVSVIAELVCLRFMHRKFTADDLGCVSDALILSLMLPAVLDFRIAAIACVFSVVAAKNIFGGRLNMIFSPAAAAYVFLYTSWKNQLLMFSEPHVRTGVFEKASSLVSSASNSFNINGKMNVTDFEILLGSVSGPAGAVSILLLAVAAVVLLFRRSISAGAFIGSISASALMALIVPASVTRAASVKYTLVTNMVLFASVYIIADRRIAPKREYYAFFYGFFLAACSYILVITTAKENAIVIMSILFTPVALGFKNLEKHIELVQIEEQKEAEMAAAAVTDGEEAADEE